MFKATLILTIVALTFLVFVEEIHADDEAGPDAQGGEGARCNNRGLGCRRPLKCYSGKCYQCVRNYGCPGSQECHSHRCIGGDH